MSVPSNLIPTRITQLPTAPVASEDSILIIVYQGNTYQIRAGDLLSVAGVPVTRQVIAGTGLTGGGQLLNNVTLSVASKGIDGSLMSDTGVTPGIYGNSTNVPVFTVDSTGRVTAATTVPATVSGYVPESRQVIAGTGLTGGGALNTNVTLNANLSNNVPLDNNNSGAAGVSTAIARADHQHPAVDLSDDDEVDGILGLSNGGTARSLTMNPGAIIWSGADGLYVGPAGSAGQALISGGTSQYTWSSVVTLVNGQSGVVVLTAADVGAPQTDGTGATGTWNIDITGNAATTTTATNASNLVGGSANRVVYQTGTNTTSFVTAPVAADTFLRWTGSAFSWSALPGAGTVTSVNGSGGTTGLTFSGGPITSSGTLTLGGTLTASNGGTGLASYTAGDTVYYATGTALSKLTIGSNGYVMTSSGTAPQWSDPNSITVGNATAAVTATNIAGGAAGSIPYQTGAGATTFLTASSGVLVGGSTPSYSTAPSLTGTNFTGIPNAALSNSSITLGTTNVALGATASTLAGLTSVAVTQPPTTALQLATKQYVDDAVSTGITIHTPVRVETPTALNATYLAGGTAVTVTDITGSKTLTFATSPSLSVNDQIVFSVTSNGITAGTAYYVYSAPAANQVTLSLSYNGPELTTLTNGTGLTITGTVNAGVGATLTNAGANAAIQIDGVNLSSTNRVLVYKQANAAHNGVYTVTTVGNGSTPWVLTRATTENTYKPDSTSGLGQGDYFFVQEGLTGAGESYVMTTANPLIIGTTNLTFTQFSASQVYSAGTGLTLTGTTFSLTSPVVTTLGGTGLTSYTAGDLPYYATGTALSKLGIGTATYLLTSSGTAPQWSDPTGVTVGNATNAVNATNATNATSATTATNVAGGAANKIVYNTAASTTSFIDAPTVSDRFLKWTGSAFTWDVAGSGTVTSVGLSLPSEFTISNSPVTTSGTLTGSWANQAANYVLAGPATGSATTPTFRALVNADVPSALTGKTYNDISLTALSTGWKASGGNTAVEVSFLGGAAYSISGTNGTAITLPATTGTVALNNQQFFVGTTQIAINRTSGSQSLTGVSIDGSAGSATNATNIAITDDTTTNATMYPVWVTANTGNLPAKVTSSKLSFNPSTGVLTATGGISGGTF